MQCQFCNNYYMTAGHYGRHLRANHSKEQRSKSLHEALPSNLQSVPRTPKHRRPSNLGAANTHSCHPLDRGHDQANIKSTVGRGSPSAPGGPAASHVRDLQPSSHTSHHNHGLDGIKSPNREATPLAPDDPVASHQQYLSEELMVGQAIRRSLFIDIQNPSWNPLFPFTNAHEYKLARFFHKSKTSRKEIDQFFHDDLLHMNTSQMLKIKYQSGHMWRKKMQGLVNEPEWQNGTVDFHLQAGVKFF